MKFQKQSLASLGLIVLLSACGGGGGDENDGQNPLSLSPAEVEIASAGCAGGAEIDITIVGGVGPFHLKNPVASAIALSAETVSASVRRFRLTTRGGCLSKIPVLVLDSDGNATEFQVTVVDPDV